MKKKPIGSQIPAHAADKMGSLVKSGEKNGMFASHTHLTAPALSLQGILRLALGVVLFVVIVAGGTALLQQSLFVWYRGGAYAHWAVILIALPLLAGLAQRLLRVPMGPLVSVIGAVVSVVLLYPLYAERFWAQAPTLTDAVVFGLICAGVAYLVYLPWNRTLAALIWLPTVLIPSRTPSKQQRSRQAKVPRGGRESGQAIALLELVVSMVSLGLSVFSIFILGQG